MSFRNLPLKGIYRTATDSLVRDFYLPCLSQASQYDRAVGFFSSSMLIEAALGLSGLIKNHGRMRLLIGHPLSDDDWNAVKEGIALSSIQNQLATDLAEMLERAGSERTVHSFELLSWMVATGSIEIRYAFRKVGMYHEKIGILKDSDLNQIVFHGSANESANALLPTRNFESLAVYPSWKEDVFSEYGTPFVDGFEDLWNNKTPDVYSVAVPSKFYEDLLNFRKGKHSPPDLEYEAIWAEYAFLPPASGDDPRLPRTFFGQTYSLRPHQEAALSRWMANSYSGIFALATGSGKTVTALHAATRFANQGYPLVLVVAVPYQILAEQWIDVMGHFGMRPIKAFYSRDQWKPRLDQAISAFLAGASKFLSVVVVNDTLASEDFLRCLSLIPSEQLFFVGDECHHHSARSWLDRVPTGAKFRLGMSATPWNPGRDEHKAVLEQLYGPVVATYSLRDALQDGVLCQYSYHWIPCNFDDDEAEEYERISLRIATLVAQDPERSSPPVQTQIQSLFARRSRLIGALRDKTNQLKRISMEFNGTPHTLFYCGEGQHPLEIEGGNGERVVDNIIRHLASDGWKIGRITASETASERNRILSSFDDGIIDAIAAIRVLDEGFDIPSCRLAFILASSNSYRQYIQRRGRVLRRAPGKDAAIIYDFVAVPSLDLLRRNKTIWRKQIAVELTRMREFVVLSNNAESQQIQINDKMKSIDLGAIYYEEAPLSEEELYGN
jgi:superfamily II DNA or RNA helicase